MADVRQRCTLQAFLLLIVFHGVSCIRLSMSGQDRSQAQTGTCWDHAVYLNADNNLERAGVQDAHELLANPHFRHGVTEGYNLKVYIERNCNDKPSRGFTDKDIKGVGCDGDKNVFASLSPGQDARRGYAVQQKLNRQPLTDPSQLENFIKAALPARSPCKQFLVLWNHGMGPFGFGASEKFDTHGMKVKEIANVLARTFGSRKLSLLGFDSCLMSSYEVLQKLTPYTEAILSSEEVEPGHGWDYSKFNPAARDAKEMGRDFIKGFMEHSHQMPRTLALISSAGFFVFQSKVDYFCNLMSKHLTNGLVGAKQALGHARQKATSFKSAVDSPGHSGSHIDLGKFLEALLTRDALPESWYDERLVVTQACALYQQAFLEKDSFSSSYTGMSAFFPGASSGKGGYDTGLGGVIEGLMGSFMSSSVVSSLFRSGERSGGWGSSRMLELYEEGLGGLGAWGTMVKKYTSFQAKNTAVYTSANGQRPVTRPEEQPGHLQNQRPQHGGMPNPGWSQHAVVRPSNVTTQALIQVTTLDPFSRNEIEFYGPASLSVTGLEIFYGKVNEEFGYLKLAGSTRPDLGRYNLRGVSTFMWWVDIYAFEATFMFLRRLRGCHEQSRDSRCWWMPKAMIMEEVQNSLASKDEPEVLKIPIEYFPDDNSDDGICQGRGVKGHMIGMIAQTQDVGSYQILGKTTSDGWSLNVQVGAGFTTVLDGVGGSFRPQEMVIPPGDDTDTSGPDFIYSTQNCVLWNGARHQKIFFNKSPEKNSEFAAVFRVELDNGRKKDLSAFCDWNQAENKYKCDATAE